MGVEAGGSTGAGVLSLCSHPLPWAVQLGDRAGRRAEVIGDNQGREGTRAPGGGQLVAEGPRTDKLCGWRGKGGEGPCGKASGGRGAAGGKRRDRVTLT